MRGDNIKNAVNQTPKQLMNLHDYIPSCHYVGQPAELQCITRRRPNHYVISMINSIS
jgi:hypothetical protein